MNRNFDDIAGIIKSEKSVTIEEMDEAIAKAVVERFNNAVKSFNHPELIDAENPESMTEQDKD
jgi:hypothetical protein